MGENGRHRRYLEFSCECIEQSVRVGELLEGSFSIYADFIHAEGQIYSSDTRMRLSNTVFRGMESEIGYCFDASSAEAGSTIKGVFDKIGRAHV